MEGEKYQDESKGEDLASERSAGRSGQLHRSQEWVLWAQKDQLGP